MNSTFGENVDPGILARGVRRGGRERIGPVGGIRIDMVCR